MLRKKKNSGVRRGRSTVYKRCHKRCWYCGLRLYLTTLTIDHLIPRSKGGPTKKINLVAACLKCNGDKGSKTLDNYRWYLKDKFDYEHWPKFYGEGERFAPWITVKI